MKVFLGGTCAGWKWRDELQPLLKCDYYNPIVKNWSEEDRLREVHERETSDYVLYGITELKAYIQLQKLLTIQTNARRKQYSLICIKHMREVENLSRWHIA